MLFAVIKQTLLVHADGHLSVRLGDEAGEELCASAPGVFRFGRWHHVCYSSALWESGPDAVGAGGRVDVFLDGASVANLTGAPTCELPHRQSHPRLGNIADDGNAAVVDVDDFARFYSFETDFPLPDAPVFSGPHAVKCLYPVAAGDLTELAPTGAPTNWQANAEALADGDTSYAEKSAGSDQHDLYRFDPNDPVVLGLPADGEDPAYYQSGAFAWGLVRDAGGVYPNASFLVRYDEAGTQVEYSYRAGCPPGGAYAFTGNSVPHTRPEVQSLQVGWGMSPANYEEAALDDAFRGSQVVLEVWYPAPPIPAPTGGARWSVGWVG
jgi:hypothetical protein